MPLNSLADRQAARRALGERDQVIADAGLLDAIMAANHDAVIERLNQGADPATNFKNYGFMARWGVPTVKFAASAAVGAAVTAVAAAAVGPAVALTPFAFAAHSGPLNAVVVNQGGQYFVRETFSAGARAAAAALPGAIAGASVGAAQAATRVGLFGGAKMDQAQIEAAFDHAKPGSLNLWRRLKGNVSGEDKAIHVAALVGQTDVIDTLIEAGADPSVVSASGAYADEMLHPDVARVYRLGLQETVARYYDGQRVARAM